MKRLLTTTTLVAILALGAPAPGLIAGPAQAQAQGQVLNVHNADIRAFIQDVGRMTGHTFVVDPRVTGTVTVTSPGPLSRTELFEVFLSTLRANGLIAVRTGSGAYRISPVDDAAQQAGGVGSERFVTEVFRLRAIDAASAAETLKPLVGRQGQILANRRSNTVVVADYADNLRRMRDLIGRIDQDMTVTETVSLRNSAAREIARVAREVAEGPGGDEGSATVSVIAVESANAVVLKGDPAAVAKLAAFVGDLDRRAESSADVRVLFLRHADAETLLPVLQEIVGQRSSAVAGAGGEGASAAPQGPRRAAVTRYPGANALIVSADPETQRVLADVVRQLDTRREQVLVEAIVVEVSDTAAKELGVQFLLSGTGSSNVPFAATPFGGAGPNILGLGAAAAGERNLPEDSAAQRALRENAVNSLLRANGALVGFAGEINGDVLFGAIISAVKRDSASNLLSTPSVLTLDNKPASILVGQEVPITTGEVLGSANQNPFRTISRQNVGVQLEVRPQINADGAITLFLRQEVSSVAGPVSAGFGELILNKREIETTVLVDDGDIVVLGGLLDQNERVVAQKVPGLGDAPLVGPLFRSKGRETVKTNLMVFIRPTIVRNPAEARELTQPRLDRMRRAQAAANPAGESSLDDLITEFWGAPPPPPPPPPPPGA